MIILPLSKGSSHLLRIVPPDLVVWIRESVLSLRLAFLNGLVLANTIGVPFGILSNIYLIPNYRLNSASPWAGYVFVSA
jgi:hypothetical protein